MTAKYKSTKEVPIEVLCDRLDELSNAISGGRKTFDNEFTMRIPAECDRDADLILSEAGIRLKQLREENKKRHTDTKILELSIKALSDAFNMFVNECLDDRDKPKQPSVQAIMAARGCLPPLSKHAFKKKNDKTS